MSRFLQQVKQFLHQYNIPIYTEHLSYSTDGFMGKPGYLYDLLPIPFTEEAVHHVAQRIRQTQDILGQRIGIENASFYVASPVSDMSESDFLNAVLIEATACCTLISIIFMSTASISALTRMNFYAAFPATALSMAIWQDIISKRRIC